MLSDLRQDVDARLCNGPLSRYGGETETMADDTTIPGLTIPEFAPEHAPALYFVAVDKHGAHSIVWADQITLEKLAELVSERDRRLLRALLEQAKATSERADVIARMQERADATIAAGGVR